MYRIELSPGEETVFRSIEELAVAIKRGVVTPRARIYHNASSKWLPIQFHPHYKTAVSMPLSQSALVAGPPVKPVASLNLEAAVPTDPPLPKAPAPRAAARSSAASSGSSGRASRRGGGSIGPCSSVKEAERERKADGQAPASTGQAPPPASHRSDRSAAAGRSAVGAF